MISYIIVSYNTVDFTVKTIESIIKCCKDYEIIVVDNDSKDGTVENITRSFKNKDNVKVIKNENNVGFSKANNIGIEMAMGDYYVFVNPDTIFIEDVGTKLYNLNKKLDNKHVILSPQILNPNKSKQNCMNIFPILSLDIVKKKINKNKIIEGCLIKTDWITGVCLGMTKETCQKLRGWNEVYDLYSEDLDICYRVSKQLNGECYVVNTVNLIHYGNQSGKQVYKTNYELEKKKTNSLRKFYNIYFDEKKFVRYLRMICFVYKNPNIKKYLDEEL